VQVLLSNELRLLYAILLHALPFAAAYLLAGRWAGGDPIQRMLDSLLLLLAVEYIAIGLPGVLGTLSPLTATAVALLAGTAMAWAGWRRSPPPSPTADLQSQGARWIFGACALFVITYSLACVFNQRLMPPMADDGLTYHLPAAVQWLQDGRISLYPVWFFNPANTWSPLAGSAWMAWLLMPAGNDVFARFVQLPALWVIFLAMIQLGRALGADLITASLVAVAAVLSRPFIGQVVLVKDDLFVSAFFMIVVAGLGYGPAARDRFSGWRIGIALGLFLATKYTALLSLPLLLLMADAPWRAQTRTGWGWKRWVPAAMVPLLLAGPWYLRNAWLTGNPLYPVDVNIGGLRLFDGIVSVARSEQLRELSTTMHVLVGGYYSLPILLAAVLVAGAIATLILRRRHLLDDPVVRICIFGPIVGISLFLLRSPYAEVRFINPSFLLLFGCCAAAAAELPPRIRWTTAGVLMGLAVLTAFAVALMVVLVLVAALLATAIGLALIMVIRRIHWTPSAAAAASLVLASALGMIVYVYWKSYVAEVEETATIVWPEYYGELAEAWLFLRDDRHVAPGATIAYTNTYLTYPLYGVNHRRRVLHVPVRADVPDFRHLPHIGREVPGEQLAGRATRVLHDQPDHAVWLQRLWQSGATYLLVARHHPADPERTPPPEMEYALADPDRFVPIFSNGAATVFALRWDDN
jgi:hypothetical protein